MVRRAVDRETAASGAVHHSGSGRMSDGLRIPGVAATHEGRRWYSMAIVIDMFPLPDAIMPSGQGLRAFMDEQYCLHRIQPVNGTFFHMFWPVESYNSPDELARRVNELNMLARERFTR